jgi:hypothetical protein
MNGVVTNDYDGVVTSDYDGVVTNDYDGVVTSDYDGVVTSDYEPSFVLTILPTMLKPGYKHIWTPNLCPLELEWVLALADVDA